MHIDSDGVGIYFITLFRRNGRKFIWVFRQQLFIYLFTFFSGGKISKKALKFQTIPSRYCCIVYELLLTCEKSAGPIMEVLVRGDYEFTVLLYCKKIYNVTLSSNVFGWKA